MIWACRSYDQWSDGTCIVLVLVLSVHFPNSISRILQKHSNLVLWTVRSQWTHITIESTVREHLILSRARKHKVLSQLGCYGDTSLEVVWSEVQWHLSSLCACKQWPKSFGAFLQKTIRTTKEVLGHKSNASEELVSPKHLRCGGTWYSYIQENMMSSFILDSYIQENMMWYHQSIEVVGYGIKGHLSSFCTNCVQFSNASRFPVKILRHIMWAAISQIYKLQATRIGI